MKTSAFSLIAKRFMQHKLAAASLVLLIVIIGAALLGVSQQN